MKVTITNMDTGHVEERILDSDEYALVMGPGIVLHDKHYVPLLGDIVLRLRQVR